MLNGRWVESHEIFDKLQNLLPALQKSEAAVTADQPTLTTGTDVSCDNFVTSVVQQDNHKKNDQGKIWKEIRFREVLLSQTESELSLMQV